jgi:HAD superfamily hydrolase (TIGR01549 family)
MIKNIFFDFDGVLAESVEVKTQAFRKLYLPYGEEIAQNVVKHHLQNCGVSRFEKFRIYHEEWLNVQLDDIGMEKMTQEFSSFVLEGVVNSIEVKGAFDFLKRNKENFQYYIITGTPTEEMKNILEKRNMDCFFEGVYGSPTKKTEWTEYIIDKEGLDRKSIVFIGDALADYKAAKNSNIHFILRETEENISLFSFFSGQRIKDMTELTQAINNISAC